MLSRIWRLCLFLSITSLVIYSCGKKDFQELKKETEINIPKGDINANFCTLDPAQVDQLTKITIVIDKSGSNVIASGGRPATDPDRSRRYKSLEDWLDTRKDNPNEFYTLIEFSGNDTSIPPDLVNIPDTSPYTNERQKFKDIVTQLRNGGSSDAGATPYKAALTTVIETIRGDAIKAAEEAKKTGIMKTSAHIIIYLSDGVPTDSSEPEIVTMIKETLMKLPQQPIYGPAISQIVLNTGYYYIDVDIAVARSILAAMAKAGKGEAYSFDGGKIDYDRLTDVFIKKVTTKMSDVIVTNLNTQWDLENFGLWGDLDGDFLPDFRELELGSFIDKADSDENGVIDGIEFLVDSKSRPCRDPQCKPERATPFQGCFDPETKELLDIDHDGLSDCDEKAVGTDPERFDSNGDDLPDYLSIKYGIPATKEDDENDPAPPAASVDTDFDGEFNLPEVKVNTPPLIDNSSVNNLKPYKYRISQSSYNSKSGVACYQLAVDDVSYATPEDNIRIYLMENETNQTGRKFIRVVDKKAQDSTVTFNPEDFKLLKPK